MAINKKELKKIKVEVDKELQEKLFKEKATDLFVNEEAKSLNDSKYSIDIDNSPASDQGRSNYCWIHTSYNMIKHILKNNYGIDDINFSFSHLYFYDKLERFNMSMESLIKYRYKKEWKHQVRNSLEIFDHGSFEYFRKLVGKYGIVISDEEEPLTTTNTQSLNYLLKIILMKFDKEIRTLIEKKDIYKLKEETFARVYRLLVMFFKEPVKSFKYLDKEYTPVGFYNKFVRDEFNNYICIMNQPELGYDTSYYTNKRRYPIYSRCNKLNLEVNKFKEVIIEQLKNKQVLYASIHSQINGDLSIMFYDDDLFEFDRLGFDFSFSKLDTIKYGYGKPNHSVCISGVDIGKDNNIKKWKVKNSVGDKVNNGYTCLSNKWFDNHCYEVYVNKKYLSEDILKLLEKKAIDSEKLYR